MTARVLVIVIGQLRAHRLSWPSFRERVLQPLGADLAVCVGRSPGNDAANPYWANAVHRWETDEYDDFGTGLDALQRKYLAPGQPAPDWRSLMRVGDQWLGGIKGPGCQPGSAAILLYFRSVLRDRIVEEGLLDRYDAFVVTRSDFVWLADHPPVVFLAGHDVGLPYGEHYGGYTDRHIVVRRERVLDVLGVLDEFLLRPQSLLLTMGFFNGWNLEKFLFLHFRRLRLRVRYMPWTMYSVRSADVPTRWAEGVFDEDLGCFVKYPNERSRAALALRVRQALGGHRPAGLLLSSNLALRMLFLRYRTLDEAAFRLLFALRRHRRLVALLKAVNRAVA